MIEYESDDTDTDSSDEEMFYFDFPWCIQIYVFKIELSEHVMTCKEKC